MPRTKVDFSKHKVFVAKTPLGSIWDLRVPGSSMERITFINSAGILSVTGDFGNWIFCREFWPSETGYVSDSYWIEKATIASTQTVYELDEGGTVAALEKEIADAEEQDYDEDDLDYFHTCIDRVQEGGNDLATYKKYAYENIPDGRDFEFIFVAEKPPIWLEAVFDGFEEVCQRMKNKEEFLVYEAKE